MSRFDDLKNDCINLQKEVTKRKNDLCGKIINNDIKLFMKEFPERMIEDNDGKFIYDDCLIIREVEGFLDIIDERGTAFGWYFDVEIDELITSDLFKYQGELYLVSDLKETNILDWEEEIFKVINKFKRSLEIINNFDLNKKEYRYYSCHEDILCKDFSEVLKVVLEREPIVI